MSPCAWRMPVQRVGTWVVLWFQLNLVEFTRRLIAR
jgi:hypothetical protein